MTLRTLALALGLAASACGYSTRLSVDGGIDSVGVEIFGNDTLERDLERELHAELSRAVRNLVDAALVSPGDADVVLSGKLTRFSRRGGIRSPDNELQQSGLIIGVRTSLVERATGRVLSGPQEVSVDVGYSLTGVGMEARSRSRALRNLAERIALDLFTSATVASSETLTEAREDDLNQ